MGKTVVGFCPTVDRVWNCGNLYDSSGTTEGEGLVGPRPHHFFAPPPLLFALKRKKIKIEKKT